MPVCLLGDLAYSFLPFIKQEDANRGKNESQQLFGFHPSFARIVIDCTFERLKALLCCLQREVYINLQDLPNVINACFVPNNICKEKQEPLNQTRIKTVVKFSTSDRC